MRSTRLFLVDIIEASDEIGQFLATIDSEESFINNNMARHAVRARLTDIGEAVGRLPADVRARYSDIDWKRITAFRNVLAHEYFGLDWSIIWNSATLDLPNLRETVVRILSEFDD